MKQLSLNLCLIFLSGGLLAQTTPMEQVSLRDMSAFRPQAGNWFIIGEVVMNPDMDIHAKPQPPAAEEAGNKKEKTKEKKMIHRHPLRPRQ
ncbi:MAG: hypothetical protein HC880_07800 [Bacteroidia bacterium]|nr:hypothetical protein [Bacteroidia bacterium]